MIRVTADEVMSWGPCWDRAKVRALLAEREAWTFEDAVDLWGTGRLPAKDFLWITLRRAVLSDKVLRLHAVRSARRALERERAAKREPSPASWEACDVAERFAHGEATREELVAARSAAYAAYAAYAESEAQVEDLILLVAEEALSDA